MNTETFREKTFEAHSYFVNVSKFIFLDCFFNENDFKHDVY